jgi:hypothetical protein
MTVGTLLLIVACVLLAIAAFFSYRSAPYGPSIGWAGLFFWALAVLLGAGPLHVG